MNKQFNIILVVLMVMCSKIELTAQQNPTPSPKQSKSVLILNGIAHIGNGEKIENSAIGFKDGKLTLVADARVIRIFARQL